ACVDLQTDYENCGECGESCVNNQICDAAECTCPPDFVVCEAQEDVCIDLQADAKNCGECGYECAPGEVCLEGECGCPPGTSLCDEQCVDLESNDDHCSECFQACTGIDHCWGGEGLSGPCDGICDNPEVVNLSGDGYRVDPLGMAARCFSVEDYHPTETNERIVCWNFAADRTLRVNGMPVPCRTNEG